MTAGGNMLPSARHAKTIVAWQFSISERRTRSWRFAVVLEPNQHRNLRHTVHFLYTLFTNSYYGMANMCPNSAGDWMEYQFYRSKSKQLSKEVQHP